MKRKFNFNLKRKIDEEIEQYKSGNIMTEQNIPNISNNQLIFSFNKFNNNNNFIQNKEIKKSQNINNNDNLIIPQIYNVNKVDSNCDIKIPKLINNNQNHLILPQIFNQNKPKSYIDYKNGIIIDLSDDDDDGVIDIKNIPKKLIIKKDNVNNYQNNEYNVKKEVFPNNERIVENNQNNEGIDIFRNKVRVVENNQNRIRMSDFFTNNERVVENNQINKVSQESFWQNINMEYPNNTNNTKNEDFDNINEYYNVLQKKYRNKEQLTHYDVYYF